MESQATILIVDDEEVGREALEGVLFSQGYSLIFAQNGNEALDRAHEFMPDMILLDVMMPNMDGFEVCRRMRSDPILAEIPILLVTALDDRVSRIKGIEAGADDFISKPFDRIELRARVRTVTRLNRYRRLLLERARFVWVTEQAREGYIILNAKDQIKYANPAAKMLLNLPPDENTPLVFLDFIKKQFVCEPEESWSHWQDTQQLESVFYLIHPETEFNRPIWLQVEMLSLPVGSETNRLLRISEVTEKLALYQEVWNFHNTIVHKLRTPLSSMVMAAELFRQQVAGKVPEETRELTDLVLLGAKRIQSEIEDVLTYLNMPGMAKTGTRFSMARAEELVSRICGELGIEKFAFSADKAIPENFSLRLSNRAVEVILWEVLENAKKFHPNSNPTVELRVSRAGSSAVRISVRDDGVSLPPEQIRQAWMPYYQGEKEFTGEVEGMGLGLSTVAKLVWEVGGKCRLANREDRPGVIVDLVIPGEVETV